MQTHVDREKSARVENIVINEDIDDGGKNQFCKMPYTSLECVANAINLKECFESEIADIFFFGVHFSMSSSHRLSSSLKWNRFLCMRSIIVCTFSANTDHFHLHTLVLELKSKYNGFHHPCKRQQTFPFHRFCSAHSTHIHTHTHVSVCIKWIISVSVKSMYSQTLMHCANRIGAFV